MTPALSPPAGRAPSVIAVGSVLAIALHLAWRAFDTAADGHPLRPSHWPLLLVIATGGGWLVFGLHVRHTRGQFGAALLAGISIVTSVVLGEYLAGTLVVLVLSGGEALEASAVRRASSALARRTADAGGITEVYAGQSPEQVAVARRETAVARTVYVGDGINDAPALTACTVGVAFGQNSDVTAEAAGAVILDGGLRLVDELFHLGRRLRAIALQSAVGGIALSLTGMAVAAAGWLPPVAGAVAQEVIDCSRCSTPSAPPSARSPSPTTDSPAVKAPPGAEPCPAPAVPHSPGRPACWPSPCCRLALALLPHPLAAQPSPAPPPPEAKPADFRVLQARTGKELTLQQLADELAAKDVVYFGELHDNAVGHRVYARLAALLVERRADTVIGMEMFERDVQGVVTDYLRGRIDEAKFLEHSRPWKEYARDYKPLIELAKEKKLDVIAGNLPRPVAAQVASKDGSASPFLPRTTTAPQDRYWELFADAMKGHPGAEGAVERMYRAQCAKDDAMAESVAGYLSTHPHRQPLVIHCNGSFHSDYGLGTAARVAARVPLAQAAVVSMVAVPDVPKADVTGSLKKAHYLLLVPAPPKPPEPAKPKDPPGIEKPSGEPEKKKP